MKINKIIIVYFHLTSSLLIVHSDFNENEAIREFCKSPRVKGAFTITNKVVDKDDFRIMVFQGMHSFQIDVNNKKILKAQMIRKQWNHNNLDFVDNDIDAAFKIRLNRGTEWRQINYFIKDRISWVFDNETRKYIASFDTGSNHWSNKFPQKVNAAFNLVHYQIEDVIRVNDVLFVSGDHYYIYGPIKDDHSIGNLFFGGTAYVDKETKQLIFLRDDIIANTGPGKAVPHPFWKPVTEFINITGMAERYGTPYIVVFSDKEYCIVNYKKVNIKKNMFPPNVTCDLKSNENLIINTTQCTDLMENRDSDSDSHTWVWILNAFCGLCVLCLMIGLILWVNYKWNSTIMQTQSVSSDFDSSLG